MNRIDEIKAEIFKNEKLADLGVEIYKETKEGKFLNGAVYFGTEADNLKKVLKKEYGIVI